MDHLCIVQGFKSKNWPLQSYDREAIDMIAKKNGLVCAVYNATIYEYGKSYDEFYIQVIYFKKSFPHVFGDDMYLMVKKDGFSFLPEEFGYAKTFEDYLTLCNNGAFGFYSHNAISIYKTCDVSLEELMIYRDMRKDLS